MQLKCANADFWPKAYDNVVHKLFLRRQCSDSLQEMIEQYVHWNEDIGEWQLKCVAYTGNNMRKQTPLPDKDKNKVCDACGVMVMSSWCQLWMKMDLTFKNSLLPCCRKHCSWHLQYGWKQTMPISCYRLGLLVPPGDQTRNWSNLLLSY